MTQTGLRWIASVLIETCLLIILSTQAFASANMNFATLQAANSKLKMQGRVEVGPRRNAECKLFSTAGRSDGFSNLYNIMIKSSSLNQPRVFRARNYENTIAAKQSEIHYESTGSRIKKPFVNTHEQLQLYSESNGTFTAVIYQDQKVLLSCKGLR